MYAFATLALLGLAVLAVTAIAGRYLSISAEIRAFALAALGVGAAWLINLDLFGVVAVATRDSAIGVTVTGLMIGGAAYFWQEILGFFAGLSRKLGDEAAAVAGDIAADLDAAGWHLSELHIDRAYLSSALVRDRGPDLAIYCKAWRVRNTGGRFAKDQFTLDFAAGQLTCPAGATMPFEPGKTVHFPAGTCAACPLRQRCTTSSHGRSVSIHPDEALLAELRQRHQDPDGRDKLRERTAVEHALAHVGHWQAAAPATWTPTRTCSTCAASPSSTISTSSPASPSPTVTS